jgi:hypothetical protein
MVSFMQLLLYSWGKSPQYPVNREWMGARGGLDNLEKRKISCACLASSTTFSVIQPVA